MTTDYLDSVNFLKKLPVYLETQSEAVLEDIVENHIRPMVESVICRISYLSHEDKQDVCNEAIWRCVKALSSYDPAAVRPFPYFSRIAFNERHRAIKTELTNWEKKPTVSLDDPVTDRDGESAAAYMKLVPAQNTDPAHKLELERALSRMTPLLQTVCQEILENGDLHTKKLVTVNPHLPPGAHGRSARREELSLTLLRRHLQEVHGIPGAYTKRFYQAYINGDPLPDEILPEDYPKEPRRKRKTTPKVPGSL